MEFQGYFKEVQRVFQGSVKGVSRNFQGYFMTIARNLKEVKGCFKCFTNVLRLFQESFKIASKKFQECFKNVSRFFRECFTGGSWVFLLKITLSEIAFALSNFPYGGRGGSEAILKVSILYTSISSSWDGGSSGFQTMSHFLSNSIASH